MNNIVSTLESQNLITPLFPSVNTESSQLINKLIESLSLERNVLPSDKEINKVWENLPDLFENIPSEQRGELLLRLTVAVSVGLFDGAINYAWNIAVTELRSKVKKFGLPLISEILDDKNYDENTLNDLKDKELLDLNLKLNLISMDSYFHLNQNREVRNNFSVAHPSIGQISSYQLMSFIDSIGGSLFVSSGDVQGVDISKFMQTVKTQNLMENDLLSYLTDKVNVTNNLQKDLIISSLYKIYCNSDNSPQMRVNALNLIKSLHDSLTEARLATLVSMHEEYHIQGKKDKHAASRAFFENIGMIRSLDEGEQVRIIKNACEQLKSVHYGLNNFYNEPPFAERMFRLKDGGIPDLVKKDYVESIMLCAMGNGYGISNAANVFYEDIIKTFSPREVEYMIELIDDESSDLKYRYDTFQMCKERLKLLLRLLQSEIPRKVKARYDELI